MSWKRGALALLLFCVVVRLVEAQSLEAGFRNPPELFRHVVSEAHRLGLQVNLAPTNRTH